MKDFGKKIFSMLLVLVLLFSSVFTANVVRAEGEEEGDVVLSWEVVENDPDVIAGLLNKTDVTGESKETLTGIVRASILLEGKSTIENGYSKEAISLDPAARSYRESLKETQDDIAAVISRDVLNGEKLDVVWNLTLAANIISANIPAEKINEIKALDGVKDVFIENQYSPQEDEVLPDQPNMSVATDMTSTNYAWAAGYTGAGSKIAIVDTGLDIDHQSFDGKALEVAISEIEIYEGKVYDLMDKDDVISVWRDLNAAQRASGNGSSAYLNTKVPYAFNYVDRNYNVTHINDTQGEHGSHVAGIAAANKYIRVSNKGIQDAIEAVRTHGNSPDAQLLVMKVFGRGGGAYDSDYFAAIEDAIVLGADSVNLSLGSSNAGFVYNTTYKDILDSLTDVDIVWANSAGNNDAWPNNLTTNSGVNYLYSDGVNFATGGSPATYSNTMSVASVDNDGFTGASMVLDGYNIYYTETSGYGNPALTTIGGDYEFVFVDGPGVGDNDYNNNVFAKLGRDVVAGKIAFCRRGDSSFFAKANAGAQQGAAAVIIVNNQPGTISMNLSGYNYHVPVVSITQNDGAIVLNSAEQHETDDGTVYYTGSITVGDAVGTIQYHSDFFTMSDFSSWGTPGNLGIKPEITTPGGNIYSVFGYNQGTTGDMVGGHDQYEMMSGTSMASPQLAGIVGVMAQYIRETGLDTQAQRLDLTRRGLIQSLLMSTATPLIEEDSGSYYSIMKQGSGLANVENAINSDIVILMESTAVNGEARKDISAYAKDGKVKAELGDDPERTGKYTVEFTLNNITKNKHYFDLNGEFFTQDLFEYYTFDESADMIVDENGDPIISTYLDTWTVGLNPTMTWYINDTKFVPNAEYDFDGNPASFDDKDAKAILDAVVAGDVSALSEDADLNGDGAITTYDAYLALRLANEAATEVPAYGTVNVRVDIDFGDELDEYDDNGAYVEGYLFVKEKDSEEGAMGIDHSIPVLGYYGSWTDPSMIDIGSVLEYEYGLEYRAPYMSNTIALGSNAYNAQTNTYTDGSSNYVLGGNPVDGALETYAGTDEEPFIPEYREERNAFSNDYTLRGVNYSLVRNAAGRRIDVADENGNPIPGTAVYGAGEYAAYYYQSTSGTSWRTTSSSLNYGRSLASIPEGSNVVIRFSAAPEYYQDENMEITWDDVKPSMEIPVMIDNTAPVFDAVFGDRVEDGVMLALSLSDNGYLAGLFVMDETGNNIMKAYGPREDEKTGRRDSQKYIVNLDGNVPDHLLVVAFDYASNATSVEINLNTEELENDIGITLDQHSATSVVGNSIRLSASFSPWGLTDQGIIWTSSDESVAVVDGNGLVTGVGEGTAVITAAAHADDSKTDTCTVTFIVIDRELNGFVWDENGDVWFSEFNTSSLPAYTKLSDNLRMPLASATYAEDGKLYVVSFDSEEWTSVLYTMEEDTFELTEIGESEFGFMDIAAAPHLGGNKILAIYGPYVLVVNRTTGQYEGAFDLTNYTGGNYLVGIAYQTSAVSGRYTYDYVYILDEAGTIYRAGYRLNGTQISQQRPTVIKRTGITVDVPFFQSLYYDGTDAYWSRYSEAENDVDIVFVQNIARGNSAVVYNLGSFADNVWPVGGLFNVTEKQIIGLNNVVETDEIDENNEDLALESINPIVPLPSSGKLNAVSGSAVTKIGREDIKTDVIPTEDDETEVSVLLKADGTVVTADGTLVTHNGLLEVAYDTNKLELKEVVSTLRYYAVNDSQRGKVVFGFIDLNGVPEDEVVAKVIFKTYTEDPAAVTITELEKDGNTEAADPIEIEIDTVKYFDVTFDSAGGTPVASQRVKFGEKAVEPEAPEKDNFVFLGWFNGEELYDFDTPVTEALVLTAEWKELDWGDVLPKDRPADPDQIPDGIWTSELVDLTYNGKAQTQEFRVYDGKTMLKEGTDYTVVYKNNVKAGTATVTITGKGNYKGKIVKTFEIKPLDAGYDSEVFVLPNVSTFVYNGKVQKPVLEIFYNGTKLKVNTDYVVEYVNPNSKEVGEYEYTVVFKGNYYGSRTNDYEIVKEGKIISNMKISKPADMTYTGEKLTPAIVIKDGTKTLIAGENIDDANCDYIVVYVENVNVGMGYVIIAGLNDYSGVAIRYFNIKPAKLTAATTQVSGLPTSVEFCGEVKPEAVLTRDNTVLEEGVDYTVTYKNNAKVGTATVTFKGIGNYTGSFSKTFKITPATNVSASAIFDQPYEKGGCKPDVMIRDPNRDFYHLENGKDYTLTYKNNTKLGKATVTAKGKGNYSFTLEFGFNIVAGNVADATMTAADKAFANKKNAYKTTVTLTDTNGKKLVAGTDYEKTLEYFYAETGAPVGADDIPVAGTTISVFAFGKGNYTGSAYAEYRIVKAVINKAKVTIPVQSYTGRPVTLSKDDITVKVGTTVLGADDYEIVSYSNNVAKGTATVVLKGVGEYGGTKTVTFKIAEKLFN